MHFLHMPPKRDSEGDGKREMMMEMMGKSLLFVICGEEKVM